MISFPDFVSFNGARPLEMSIVVIYIEAMRNEADYGLFPMEGKDAKLKPICFN